jgi:DNA-binding response OmpR family regulator
MASTSYDPAELPSLKLTAAETRRVIDGLNRRGGGAPVERKRRLRIPFEKNNVVVETDDGSGRIVRHRVVSRNLSTHGIAVIHGQFMHVKRPCIVEIPMLDAGAMFRVKAHIERCRLVTGRVHEVAIVFETPIDLSMFIQLDVESEMRTRTEAQTDLRDVQKKQAPVQLSLAGNALVVEDFESNRKLYNFWLTKLGLHVQDASEPDTALKLVSKHRFNLVLVDQHLGEQSGGRLISEMRQRGVTCLIIATSAEVNDEIRAAAQSAGADLYLAKPFDRGTLEATIQAHIDLVQPMRAGADAIGSELHDPEMAGLIKEFVAKLPGIAGQLESAAGKPDLAALQALTVDLAESTRGYGFGPLHIAGYELLKLFNCADPNLLAIRRSTEKLSGLMRRCRAA